MEAFERGLLFEQSAEFASWTQQQRKTFRAENLAHKARAVRWLRGPDIATTDPEDDTAEDET